MTLADTWQPGKAGMLSAYMLFFCLSLLKTALCSDTCLCALQRLSRCMLPLNANCSPAHLSGTPLRLATGACQHRSCSSSLSPLTGRTSRLLLQQQPPLRPAAAPAVLPVTAVSTHTLPQPVRLPLLTGTRSIRWVGGWVLTRWLQQSSSTHAGMGNNQASMVSCVNPPRAGTSGRQIRVRV